MIVAFSVSPSGAPADVGHAPSRDGDPASVHEAVAAALAERP
ncbi:hypothetical protein [Micrococcus sp.]|nr:hypothetical protein [Micrococcus sp.]MDY6056019.1 hypothetical protein [Micrococcus sp.]